MYSFFMHLLADHPGQPNPYVRIKKDNPKLTKTHILLFNCLTYIRYQLNILRLWLLFTVANSSATINDMCWFVVSLIFEMKTSRYNTAVPMILNAYSDLVLKGLQ